MRVLVVHERYRQRGGEDVAVDLEVTQLRAHGVTVDTLIEDNSRLTGDGSLGLAARSVWSVESRGQVAEAIRIARPDVMHVHNFFPLLSPSIYRAAVDADVPVVQTLHNYRLLCANAMLLREGRDCTLCVGRRLKWPAVRHRCYRGSAGASAAVAIMAGLHHTIGTFAREVDQFVAQSRTAARMFVDGGIPAEKLNVIPNAVADPQLGGNHADRQGALYVGRLSPEKGLDTLVAAWRGIDLPLTVIGDGPQSDRLRAIAPPSVRFVGSQPHAEVSHAMSKAALLVFPSICRESFPLVPAEAAAHGLPVLASRGGAVEDLIEDGVSGVLAPPGDVGAWRSAAQDLLLDPARLMELGRGARSAYEAHCRPDIVVNRRLNLYRRLIDARRRK